MIEKRCIDMQYFGLNKPNSALINMICENFLQDLRYAYIYVQYCNTFIIAAKRAQEKA